MELVSKLLLLAAIVWTVGRMVRIRAQVRNGGIIIPPIASATLVFTVSIIVVLATGISALHLLWLFPVSFVLGTALLISPLGVKIVMGFILILGGLGRKVDK